MYLTIAAAFLVLTLTEKHTQDHGAHQNSRSAETSLMSDDAPIKISINPEARLSVSRGGKLPPITACGTPIDLQVRIVNQGFVTVPLEASFVDSVPKDVSLEFTVEPLKGVREEQRLLRVTLNKPGLFDVTISFRAKRDILDLGGRDRVHFLIGCN
jgi:hypothetical protein